jgi:hypothetical protein
MVEVRMLRHRSGEWRGQRDEGSDLRVEDMMSRRLDVEVLDRRWRAVAVATVLGLAVAATACDAESGSNEYFRASVDYRDFGADCDSELTVATCNASATYAALYAVNAAGDEIKIFLDNCADGSYGIVLRADDTTTGVTECDYTRAADDALYQAQAAYADSSCDVVISWVDGYAMGTVHAVLIDYDILTGIETDRAEVYGEFYLALGEAY